MSSLIENLGLKKNPFSVFSAEEEREYLSEIYFKPRYFDTIFDSIENGASQFIFGGRGNGKSALVIELNTLLQASNTFTIIMGNYEGIALDKNEADFLHKILEQLVKSFSAATLKSPNILKKLNSYQRERLAFLIKEFFATTSKKEYLKIYDKTAGIATKNILKRLWNNIFSKPINILASSVVEISSDFIRKSLNLPDVDSKVFIKDYFPEFEIEKIQKEGLPKNVANVAFLKGQTKEITEIITACGYNSVVVFIDRIDEFSELNGQIDKIANFIKDLMLDTDLLYTEKLSLVFSLWSELKEPLNALNVRFDKFKPTDVTWKDEDLKRILQKRLDHFAKSGLMNYDLFCSDISLQSAINLSHNSPRDLMLLMSRIISEQQMLDSNVKCISNQAVENGKLSFVKNYDYHSLYHFTKIDGEEEQSIYYHINSLLKIGRTTLTVADVESNLNIKKKDAYDRISVYKNYGLINEIFVRSTHNINKEFQICDPKISYMIEMGIVTLPKV